MRKVAFFFLLTLLPGWIFSQTPPSCAADLYREMYARQYPELAERARKLELQLDSLPVLQNRSLIVIPVVVHVVYHTAPENISQEQIESQIEVLNADYRAQNDNLDIIPAAFLDLIADTELEFCLAVRDPEGHATTGITRDQTVKDNIGLSSDVHYAIKDGADAWDPDHYLNIWVADMGENTLGRASFPGTVPPAEDGIVVDPRYFGTTGSAAGSAPYNLGRTAVHEIGHYFNLMHPWGSGLPSLNCLGDDLVLDTPITSRDYLQECPSSLQVSCGTLDMYTNYMYYTDDACMAQFTPGQKLRMLATLLLPPRLGLTLSQGCLPVGVAPDPSLDFQFSIQPNPSSGEVVFECKGQDGTPCHLQIFDAMGRMLLQMDIPGNQPYRWVVPEGLGAGVYWVRVEVDGKWVLKTLQILR